MYLKNLTISTDVYYCFVGENAPMPMTEGLEVYVEIRPKQEQIS